MRAIPFENIDPLLGIVPKLSLEAVAAKLIERGRGGYCFEHNALFGEALRALGYQTCAHLARVRNGAGQGGARTHHTFTVSAEGDTWLCDTGFGGHASLHPLRLSQSGPQETPNGTFRVRLDQAETLVERQGNDKWIPLYGFDGLAVREIDLEAANFLCARWEGAPFSTNLMVAFHSREGRVALFNRALTLGQPPDAVKSQLGSCRELDDVLRGRCGLNITTDVIDRIWARVEHIPPGS